MNSHLPTLTSAQWTVTGLRDSLECELGGNKSCNQLTIFAYAVTESGWNQLRPFVTKWQKAKHGRMVRAYVGTDHALTAPDAVRRMLGDGVNVHLLIEYTGVFHPKVIWLAGPSKHLVWIGSNNLTYDGLMQNIEFASLVESGEANPELSRWFDVIKSSSEPFSEALLKSYEKERREFSKERSKTGTFTWSMRREPAQPATPTRPKKKATSTPRRVQRPRIQPRSGDLVLEIMRRETGQDGKQIQLPLPAVTQFFGLPNRRGASLQISLRRLGTRFSRTLTMTVFHNDTSRLSVSDLDYRDRPCFIFFRDEGTGQFVFEIVSRSVFPDRYRQMERLASNQTRSGSRRWAIV